MAPEKSLWAEVLRLALADFCDCHGRVVRGRSREIFQLDAARWIDSTSREPGSFLFCCQALDVDASAVRRVLAGDIAALRMRVKRNPKPTRAPVVGLFDPAFEATTGRRIGSDPLI